MPFRSLPRRLQLYILAHPVALVPLLWLVWRLPESGGDPALVGTLLGFTFLLSTWKTELTVLNGKVTPTFAVVCLAMLLVGSRGAVLCAALGAAVGSLVRPVESGWRVRLLNPPFYRLLFNTTNCAAACAVAGLVFHAGHAAGQIADETAPLAPTGDLARVLTLFAFTLCYFLVNTVGVSVAIALERSGRAPEAAQPAGERETSNWFAIWRRDFLWTAPGYLASASIAAAIRAVYAVAGDWSLVLLPPVYLLCYFYRLYVRHLRLFEEKTRQQEEHIAELNRLNRAIIASLATAIDAKDRVTCSHINRVQHYAVALAKAAGLSGPELEAVATGALVHDIGKLGIPDHILGKPGKLTAEEFRRIQSHVEIGAEILAPIPFPFPVVEVVRSHHERWDGLGYPRGLKGEEIPIGGRIIAIVDVFDALTSDRPYRRAMAREEAIAILREGAGKQFDPQLVERFLAILPEATAQIERMEAEQQVAAAARAAAREQPTSALARISQTAVEMAMVSDVAHSLAGHKSVDQIVQSVASRALALLPADTAAVYLHEAPAQQLVARAVEGKYREKLLGMAIEFGEGVAGWVARHQQPLVNASAMLDIARRCEPEEVMDLSAVTAVPLIQGPETVGVLAVYTSAYSITGEHHVQVLNILAENATAAIQSLRRFERNEELAYTDALTGLANSRCLLRHLEALTRPARRAAPGDDLPRFALLILDLDRFKDVNDRFGHLRGDEVLQSVAELLLARTRAGDVVGRYAGDEFMLLLPDAGREHAERVARRLRAAIGALQVEEEAPIGASVGVACFPEDATDARALMQVADRRMYEDKASRRARGEPSTRPGPTAPASEESALWPNGR